MRIITPLTKTEKGLLLALIIMAIPAVFFYSTEKKENERILQEVEFINNVLIPIDEKIVKKEYSFKAISIYDLTENSNIYGRNDQTPLPLASLAKTMTGIVALETNKEGYNVVTKEALQELGDTGLIPGELWETPELVKFMLVSSSNDAATVLASYDENFVKKMNAKAKNLGLSSMTYSNTTGLDVNNNPGGYGSAGDVNTLVSYMYKNFPKVAFTTSQAEVSIESAAGNSYKLQNTNIVTDKIPNLQFSKTGFTKLAGGNLAIIFKNKEGHDLAITILGGTESSRFSDMASIVDMLYNWDHE